MMAVSEFAVNKGRYNEVLLYIYLHILTISITSTGLTFVFI